MPTQRSRLVAPLLAALLLLTAACTDGAPAGPSTETRSPASQAPSATEAGTTMVLAISVDGLKPEALRTLGRSGAPSFWRLVDEGASTFNARTPVEMTATLPSHTTMLTGRRISAGDGGHGYTTNIEAPGRVLDADGLPPLSVFDVVHDAGLTSALFASKDKFAVFDRTWPAIDEFVIDTDDARLAEAAEHDLVTKHRAFTFLHLSAPDKAGHATHWMSTSYLQAVSDVDARLGDLLDTIDATPYLREHLVLVLTADHGGEGPDHRDPSDADDYTIPFVVRGPGVAAGADLYALNPERRDPGVAQPGYDVARQPVRNGDVANLATGLLGLEPVPTSQMGVDDPLLVRR